MNSRLLLLALAGLLSVDLAVSPTARANVPEDIQGVHARTNAMGGAGTALGHDYGSAYYNPAGLSFCETDTVGADIRHTVYSLEMRDRPADVEENKELRDQTRVTAGGCLKLPYRFTMGVAFGIGLQNPMTLDQSTPNERPQFNFYGEHLETLAVMAGLAYQPIPELSLGLGASILVNSAIGIGATMPIGTDADGDGVADYGDVSFAFSFKPAAAPYVGVLGEPFPGLRLGIAFRGALFHDLNTPVSIDVDIAGIAGVTVPLYVESAAWYTPRQLAIGAAYDPIDELTLAFDITFYNWALHPGPFLIVTELPSAACDQSDPSDPDCAPLLSLPTREDYGYRNIFVPRVGGEARFLDGRVAMRGGYSFRPSILELPTRTRANLLDGAVHSVSIGGGYRLGSRPPALEEGAPLPPRGETQFTAEADVFFRANAMPWRTVEKAPESGSAAVYRFGGAVYDLGVTFTLGWY